VVRNAKFGDIPRLTELLEQGHRRSKYRDRGTICTKEAKSLLVNAIQRHGLKSAGGSCVFVSEYEGVVDGFIAGLLERIYHIGDKLSAADFYFYVAPDGSPASAGDLADAFIDWALGIETVIVMQLSATDIIQDYERTAALYRRKGFTQTGVIYERRTDL
jgi:hypothetical protein